MKRYKMHGPINTITRLNECMMLNDLDGEWVKYGDVKKKVEAYDDWVERGIWIARITDPIICNCYEHSQVEMSESWYGRSFVGITWVCPAHGYKERVI